MVSSWPQYSPLIGAGWCPQLRGVGGEGAGGGGRGQHAGLPGGGLGPSQGGDAGPLLGGGAAPVAAGGRGLGAGRGGGRPPGHRGRPQLGHGGQIPGTYVKTRTRNEPSRNLKLQFPAILSLMSAPGDGVQGPDCPGARQVGGAGPGAWQEVGRPQVHGYDMSCVSVLPGHR